MQIGRFHGGSISEGICTDLRNLRMISEVEMERTRRQEIRGLLSERAWTLDELAARYLLPKRVLVNDLEHIARSIAPRQRIEILAPTCEACGFRFKDRTRFSDPSRCPRCKNEHLSSQRLRII